MVEVEVGGNAAKELDMQTDTNHDPDPDHDQLTLVPPEGRCKGSIETLTMRTTWVLSPSNPQDLVEWQWATTTVTTRNSGD